VKIEPMPPHQGVGFCAREPFIGDAEGYRAEQVGPYHNYHFTERNYRWPSANPVAPPLRRLRLDGFSPNLNKSLHIGHLRNLALAASLRRILDADGVALLGAAMGTVHRARAELARWYDLADYRPTCVLDTDLYNIEFIYPMRDGEGEQSGCKVWDGPRGPVIVVRSDGRPTYAYHDLMFQALYSPSYYITGEEQSDHFKSLGLDNKHLLMGLVQGLDGKKIKSREGEAVTADAALSSVSASLRGQPPEVRRLGWNILAWNFLSVGREQSVKFDPGMWSRPEQPGLYISYTYARLSKALSRADVHPVEIEPQDVPIVGNAAYFDYYLDRARTQKDASPLAQYALRLAKCLTRNYDGDEQIVGGRPSFRYAMHLAQVILGEAMYFLSMYPMDRIGE
jgi:arginyl-tRNA synthetase